ncbi:hypothetical protein V5F59_14365 [Xanthobacter autotrophicus DSM 431]|uniref:hypothetical protein n=1 Tax=Xanthobacter nonsaccharivorans TaxID=3119912 RepID=UPI003727C85A
MVDEQRRMAIKKAIEAYTAKHTVSRKVARETLIAEGIYTQKGKLRAEFGGGKRRKAETAA